MFCPRCSQEQISDETKFCSRCGFDLRIVSVALENEGFLPQLAELQKSKKKLTNRMGVFFGLSCWLVVCFLFDLVSALFGGRDEIIVAAVGLMLGILIMILSAPFIKPAKSEIGESLPEDEDSASNILGARNGQIALTPQQILSSPQDYVSPAAVWKSQSTGKLVESPSVVENTTKLLNQNK